MSARVALECIKQNAELAERTIMELKSELETLTDRCNKIQIQRMQEENGKLARAVEEAKKRLIQLETKNGIKQILLSSGDKVVLASETAQQCESKPVSCNSNIKGKKETKAKEPKEKPSGNEPPIDVGRLDLRIAKVQDVQKHPDADSLYVLKIDCGEQKPRTVCSGLVKHVSIDELRAKWVVLLCNLKPVKMRGITSEAMVMCASSPDRVEVLSPPPNCEPGELVQCEGYTRNADAVMNPKKKIFETVAPDLFTDDHLQACYKGVPFSVAGKGNIVATTLKNCPVK